ncbi:hypothetical protein DICPUDRAFT_81247 [Dictyostelium purpureum]|uniref:Isochorismatase-like domain-containing protein n=1 Tax=Dictyostelium purpureum TaxID=5786 RepID=F0ZSX3_DICPU|nr:uncharacterized protein DICPUDRAFT_81247 [Dictyostelium purpureum]EGC32953.1 hypothetical protein DICPUDRAFT_81247 [Dictyostelium purpureum]|eukprot:XP_003290519.1 hypothetical protein DICPUDRAFT_81247 [Dictyostelium purpureum]
MNKFGDLNQETTALFVLVFNKNFRYGELEETLDANKHKVFEKTKYSMWDESIKQYIQTNYPHLQSIIITGYELHVCLFQTAIDLGKAGYETHIITDGSGSINKIENDVSLKRIRQMGTFLATTEMTILHFVKDEKHPHSEIIYKKNSDRIDELKKIDINK